MTVKPIRGSQNLPKLKKHPRLVGESWTYFRDWLEGKSERTQESYLRGFTMFLDWADRDTEGLYAEYLELVKDVEDPRRKKRMGMLVVDFQKHLMESEGVKGASTEYVNKAVKGFFRANELMFEINGERVNSDTSEIPNISHDQLTRVLGVTGSFKNKAFILFARDSGLRLGDITRLPIRVIRLALDNPGLVFHTFEWKQSKTKRFANPVLGPTSLEALRTWIDYRVNTLGIPMGDDDPVFCIEKTVRGVLQKDGKFRRGATKGGYMSSSAMGVRFGALVKKAKLKPLPGETRRPSIHSLRKMHKTTLEYAGVPTSWVNKMEGRKGEGTGGVYTKPNPEELIEIYSMGYEKLDGAAPNHRITELEAQVAHYKAEVERRVTREEGDVLRAEIKRLSERLEDLVKKIEG